MRSLRQLLTLVRLPLALICISLAVDIAARFGLMPSSNQLFVDLSAVITAIDPIWVAILSAVEHTVVINVYFPAAVVILVSMGGTYGSPTDAVQMFLYILAGQLIGYTVSFLIGKIATPFRDSRGSSRWSFIGLFFTLFHPHSGAITCFFLGTKSTNLSTFFVFLFLSLLFWSPFWAVVSYFGLINIVSDIGWDLIFYGYLSIWIVYVAIRYIWKSKFPRD